MDLTEYRETVVKQTKKRKAPDHEESRTQIACVSWFNQQYPKYVLFAIPNGGERVRTEIKTKTGTKKVPLEAIRMKKEGVRPGVGDLFLMCPGKGYHGLFIEMKTEKGTQSPEQKDFQELAMKYGYKYTVCRTLEGFMRAVNDYLK